MVIALLRCKVYTLRVRDQTKQATHSRPTVSLSFSRSYHSATPDPEQEDNQGNSDKSQVPQVGMPTTGLHNSN
jgi:hypothetical protein